MKTWKTHRSQLSLTVDNSLSIKMNFLLTFLISLSRRCSASPYSSIVLALLSHWMEIRKKKLFFKIFYLHFSCLCFFFARWYLMTCCAMWVRETIAYNFCHHAEWKLKSWRVCEMKKSWKFPRRLSQKAAREFKLKTQSNCNLVLFLSICWTSSLLSRSSLERQHTISWICIFIFIF